MKQNEAVLALLKTGLWGAERFPFRADENTDWQAVYKELSDHAVISLAVDVLPLIPGIGQELRQKWIMSSTRKMMFWHKILKTQQELCELLWEKNIPFAVLKGSSAAVYYPKPEYRTMGDIDVLVRPEDFDRVFSHLRQQGWETGKDGGRHIELKKDGVELELHRYFSTLADGVAAQKMDDLLVDALERMEKTTLGRYSLPLLPRLENGLVLLAHIGQHVRSGLGLRQIIDWMLFVDREMDDRFWSEEFRAWARLTGMETLAVHVTRMCQLYMGLREDGITWCADADEALCGELMELTLARGNFGRKLENYTTMASVLGPLVDWKNIPKTLQMRGEYNWKALKKHPWLRPFAWVYQICRYIRRGLKRKITLRRLRSDMRQVSRESQLWDRLGVALPREAAELQADHSDDR